jgi:hypothetical protein
MKNRSVEGLFQHPQGDYTQNPIARETASFDSLLNWWNTYTNKSTSVSEHFW